MSQTAFLTQLHAELSLPISGIQAVLKLLAEGNTVPFIARYRKEATGNLDEVNIRHIQERHSYLQELEERRQAILASIDSQGKLTPELKSQILASITKTALEDLYLPYKPKRRTRASIAREKGLEPLALKIIAQVLGESMQIEAEKYIDSSKGLAEIDDVLAGARDIVAELVSENVNLRAAIRAEFTHSGIVFSKLIEGKGEMPNKFEPYYHFSEQVAKIPSHRYLAIRRGEKEGILECLITIELEVATQLAESIYKINQASNYALELKKAIQDSCKRLILPAVETDVRLDLKMKADRSAIDIFAANLRHLLLAAPFGSRTVIGIDPGLRTGSKCAVIDATGNFITAATLFLTQGERAQIASVEQLLQLIATYTPSAIAIGNGTGGRETESFVRRVIAEANLTDLVVVQVNEAGASVYSASDCARAEFPDIDLTIRGAISIARRLQDPLAELVKIDPKAIGVGQYQHDVNQHLLQEKLGEVVESCVNGVGVEINTASDSLLSYVAGIGPSLAKKIVLHRHKNGPFESRMQLLKISGFGPRAYEQAAGFLRVFGGQHPLDSSAVHPERYSLVEKMAADLNVSLFELMGNKNLIQSIDLQKYVCASIGEPTLQDIMNELLKPGRDPRAEFEKPQYNELVHKVSDVKVGMKLEGVVTNVTAFGAFVDIGVHQDGLVHISELSERYVTDPNQVVKAGDKLKVVVLAVDAERKKISLSVKQYNQATTTHNVSKASPLAHQKKNVYQAGAKSKFGSNPFASL